jgi:urease accessory protein
MDQVIKIQNKCSQWDDTVSLNFEQRFKRRVTMYSDSGYEFFLSLEKAAELPVNGVLVLESKKKIKIIASSEDLMKVQAKTKIELMRAIWHIGNRHLNCDICDNKIILKHDDVIAGMLVNLGCEVSYFNGPFIPLSGAYGIGRTFSHSH